jgi:hypothetical protein
MSWRLKVISKFMPIQKNLSTRSKPYSTDVGKLNIQIDEKVLHSEQILILVQQHWDTII